MPYRPHGLGRRKKEVACKYVVIKNADGNKLDVVHAVEYLRTAGSGEGLMFYRSDTDQNVMTFEEALQYLAS